MPATRPERIAINQARLTRFRLFPATNALVARHNMDGISEKAAIVIEKSRTMLTSARSEEVRIRLNELIQNTTNVVQWLYSVDEATEEEREGVDMHCLQMKFDECAIILNWLPDRIQQEDSLASISYKIAGVCLYLLVWSASITIGATFGAWYFGYLSATYFVDMLMSSFAYFDIPVLLVGLVSLGIGAYQTEPSSDLNVLTADVGIFFDTCRDTVEQFRQNMPIEQLQQ